MHRKMPVAAPEIRIIHRETFTQNLLIGGSEGNFAS